MGYTDTFNVENSSEGAAAGRRLSNTQKVAFGCFGPAGTPLSTTVNQRLFGIQLFIDGATSLESSSGTCGGCPLGAGIVWNSCIPGVLSGAPTTPLYSPSRFGNCVGINGGGSVCFITPTKKLSWGQLKSMYR